jgi:hypothetical protein
MSQNGIRRTNFVKDWRLEISEKPERALLVMAKRPFPGRTKTRLVPPFSPSEVAVLYECFLRDVLDTVRNVPDITPFIAFTPIQEIDYFRQLAPDFGLIPQEGQTLGQRLEYVLRQVQSLGFRLVAAINSDSPTLPAAYLSQAFTELDKPVVDVVFGPCEDGGYYLIGWKRPFPRLVLDVRMSTSHVLRDTLALADEEKARAALLPSWYDVDDVTDWERLKTAADLGRHTQAFLKQ